MFNGTIYVQSSTYQRGTLDDDDDDDNDNNDDHMIATTAAYLPLAAFSSTSWKASNIRMVLLNPSAAVLAE